MKMMAITTSFLHKNQFLIKSILGRECVCGYFDNDLLVGGRSSTWYNAFLAGKVVDFDDVYDGNNNETIKTMMGLGRMVGLGRSVGHQTGGELNMVQFHSGRERVVHLDNIDDNSKDLNFYATTNLLVKCILVREWGVYFEELNMV